MDNDLVDMGQRAELGRSEKMVEIDSAGRVCLNLVLRTDLGGSDALKATEDRKNQAGKSV